MLQLSVCKIRLTRFLFSAYYCVKTCLIGVLPDYSSFHIIVSHLFIWIMGEKITLYILYRFQSSLAHSITTLLCWNFLEEFVLFYL